MHGGYVCDRHGGRAPQVKRKATERLADLIDPDRIIREAARVALSDIGQIFDAKGHLLPVHRLPPQVRAVIASVEVTKRNLEAGDGEQEDIVRVKLWDKLKGLDLLFRHLGLLKDRMEIEGGKDLLALLDAGRARNAQAKE